VPPESTSALPLFAPETAFAPGRLHRTTLAQPRTPEPEGIVTTSSLPLRNCNRISNIVSRHLGGHYEQLQGLLSRTVQNAPVHALLRGDRRTLPRARDAQQLSLLRPPHRRHSHRHRERSIPHRAPRRPRRNPARLRRCRLPPRRQPHRPQARRPARLHPPGSRPQPEPQIRRRAACPSAPGRSRTLRTPAAADPAGNSQTDSAPPAGIHHAAAARAGKPTHPSSSRGVAVIARALPETSLPQAQPCNPYPQP
jgi:hypothetical protein